MELNGGNENGISLHKDVLVFDNFNDFSRAIEGLGLGLDFPSIIKRALESLHGEKRVY